MSGMSTSQNTYGLPFNRYGLVDKQDEFSGLQEKNLESDGPSITQRDNILMFDTRDCIGTLSLREARTAFSYEAATRGKLTPEQFRLALNSNGVIVPSKLVSVVSELGEQIPGFPERENSPNIDGNVIRFELPKKLKHIKSLEIINAIIPRDIIPMYVYFPGFINNCIPIDIPGTGITYLNPTNQSATSVWESPIPETYEDFIDKEIEGISSNKLGGVYYTPLRYWRSYTGPNCMANPHTPPPYQLWNPPQDNISDDPWPFQPQPVRNQRVPTYRARNGVIFSGYGLYDLDDFPNSQELQLADGSMIQIPLRKLILKLLVPDGQYINGVSALELIDISTVDDFNDSGIVDNPLLQTGYGDYQRFIPGPGVAMNYQPNQPRDGKSAPIELGMSTYDPDTGSLGPMPVPFPNFRGNVWGPYGRPGDRFQDKGLQSTVDELYLNGDLSNLEGNPIINPSYNPSEGPYSFEFLITSLKRANNIVRFQTVESASNPNIKNAMRVEYDGGFGAVYAYVGANTTMRGEPGPIVTGGLPNTQYDGSVHKFNHEVWVTPRTDIPGDWLQSLPGPQKPSIVKGPGFPGWIYIWRNIFPWTGNIYVPITAGGVGPMEYFDGDNIQPEWRLSKGTSQDSLLTLGSSQWVDSPVIGQSNTWCVPMTNVETFEYVSNLNYGITTGLDFTRNGYGYQDSFADFPGTFPQYKASRYSETTDNLLEVSLVIEVTNNTSYGGITSFDIVSDTAVENIFRVYIFSFCTSSCTNPEPPSEGMYALYYRPPSTLDLIEYHGGFGYTVQNSVVTINETGTGSGLTIDILEVWNQTNIVGFNGSILTWRVNFGGSGYKLGDVIRVLQPGSRLNATFVITEVTGTDENKIPDLSTFHYIDPRAQGPGNFGINPILAQNFIEGIDTCDTVCDDVQDNCTYPGGEYVFKIGEKVAAASTSQDDPRPIPVPEMTKCEFISQESPQVEWDNDLDKTCRPLDNPRLKQTRSYIDSRVSYNDLGSNQGTLIGSLINYRSFFVSSTPDTDIVIRITQAERSGFVQSLNSTLNQSNFYIPIRLNLGTTSGTLEYVEAVQGTLTSSGVYWKKDYYPPKAELANLEMSLWTYDGTPIPIERCLGFIEQFTSQALLFSSGISSIQTIHGDYETFTPNLPPFMTTYTSSPSSVIITANNNSKTLDNPYDPKTIRYTQRNLGLMFKIVTYNAQNPGVTGIIKRMPQADTLVETFEDDDGNFREFIPLAGNIDDYTM